MTPIKQNGIRWLGHSCPWSRDPLLWCARTGTYRIISHKLNEGNRADKFLHMGGKLGTLSIQGPLESLVDAVLDQRDELLREGINRFFSSGKFSQIGPWIDRMLKVNESIIPYNTNSADGTSTSTSRVIFTLPH